MTTANAPTSARRSETPDTRHDILVTAIRLFREVGYRKTTVADIAAELKMSPANVYRFFDSKKAINEAVAQHLLSEIADELAAIVARRGDPAATRLRAFMAALALLSEERFMTNRRVYDMVEAAMSESWGVCDRYVQRVSELLAQLIADGVAGGEFDVADPTAAALCVHGSMVCLCHPQIMAQKSQSVHPSATLDQMADFALRALGAVR